jgi:hypothetical protein
MASLLMSVTLAVAVVSASALHAQGAPSAGKPVKEARSVAPFSGLHLAGPMDVSYSVAPHRSIRVIGSPNMVPLIVTKVEADELQVTLSVANPQSTGGGIPYRVVITGPHLERVRNTGSGRLYLTGLRGDSLIIKVQGSGNVVASGTVGALGATVEDSGALDTSKLNARVVRVVMTGSGSADVFASEALEGRVTGSGTLDVQGSPADRTVEVPGTGTVRFFP